MDNIIGHKIVAIRKTTAAEREQMYWSANGIVFTLDNGVSLMPVTSPARWVTSTPALRSLSTWWRRWRRR